MAKIGLAHLCFAPFDGAEPTDALPTYGTGTELTGAVSANLTVNYAEAELFADDDTAESAREFVSADLATELASLPLERASKVLGVTAGEDGEYIDNVDDIAPYGGVGYYQTLSRNNKKVYRARFFPKARASVGADNAQTKGSTITFNTEGLAFKVYRANNGNWRYTAEFESKAEAIAWINSKLGIDPTPAATSNDQQ